VRDFAEKLGAPNAGLTNAKGPVWTDVTSEHVLEFLDSYRLAGEARSISLPLIRIYIERLGFN
jgi:hypothetical protein